MRERIKGLYPGCKLKPVNPGGFEHWYPYITFVEQNNEKEATVILANGKRTNTFNTRGWMEFVVVDDCLENK